MCIDIGIEIDLLELINSTWTALSRPIGYLQDPKHIIAQLTNAMEDLRHQRDHIIRAVELDEEMRTLQIQSWLDKVAAINAKVLKIIADHENGSFRWCINRRVVQSLADVTRLAEEFSSNSVTIKLPPNRVEEIPGEPLISMPTMNAYLSKLRTYLQEDGYGIIGIWGMGGVGKTTLLRGLNNDLLPDHNNELLWSSKSGQSMPMFNHIIWAVGSKDYQPSKLRLNIAERLGLTLSSSNELQQAMEINNFLKNRSFILLLDDLWQSVDLAELGIPQLLRTGATNQKVVFTTRLEGICGKMQVRHKIKIDCLTKEEAWKLFMNKVGDETLQVHVRIPELAQRVAEECGRLPLALVVIGSAMSTKRTPREWQNAITLLQKSRPYEIHDMDDKIFPKLKFSYDNLADEIFRKCFLLCSLWPEDYSISKEDLIECWMGHGLVDERKFENINEAYDNGYALIGGLQAACLLEPGNNKDREVKMHDVVRDLALWIASDYGGKPNRFFVLSNAIPCKNIQGEVERISLFDSDLSDTSFLPANCSKLETLMIHNSSYSMIVTPMVQKSSHFKSIVSGFFEGTRALTYLDLSSTTIDNLPQEIGLLGNLRYLNLSDTKIRLLPLQLGNLLELRFLLLRNLESISIPCGVLEELVMLSVIDMTDTWCNNWQELSRLRGSLKGIGIILESIKDLRQLAQLPNVLTWRLELRELLGFNEPLQLLSPSLLGSRSIRSSIQMLRIEQCLSLEVVSMESDGEGGIQKWYLSRLEELKLKSLPNLKEVVWRGVYPAEMLPSLTMLEISGCHKLSNISWVIQLPSLEFLLVEDCDQMQQIIDNNSEFAHCGEKENGVGTVHWTFPSLKRLLLNDLKRLSDFGGSFTFPSLEVLEVDDCPNMKILPFGADMAGKKLKRIAGPRNWWEELNMEDDARAALEPYFSVDSSLLLKKKIEVALIVQRAALAFISASEFSAD